MCEAHIIPVYMYTHDTRPLRHYNTLGRLNVWGCHTCTCVYVSTHTRAHNMLRGSMRPSNKILWSDHFTIISCTVRSQLRPRSIHIFFFYNIIIEPITFGSRSRTPHIILLYTIIIIITPVTHIPSVRYSIYTYVYRSCSSWTYVFYVQFFPETSSAVYTMTPGKRFRYDICLPTSIGFMRLIWSEGRLILLHSPVIIIYLTRLKIMLSEI